MADVLRVSGSCTIPLAELEWRFLHDERITPLTAKSGLAVVLAAQQRLLDETLLTLNSASP